MDEPIQSEVSQKEKYKYHVQTHIYGIKKDGTDESICRAAMEMQTQKTDLWTRRGGESETSGERSKIGRAHV